MSKSVLIFPLFVFAAHNAFTQKAFLVKKNKDTVFIREGYIGLTTKENEIKYKGYNNLSYVIEVFNKDSLLLKRPIKYHDTEVSFENYNLPYIGKEYRFQKSFRNDGKLKCKLQIIDQYEYNVINTRNITSIYYPPKSDIQVGCIFCVFIPVYNIFYIRKTRKYYIPKKYDLKEWTLIF